jgi:MFS family permease
MLLDFFATLLTRSDPLMPIVANDILKVGPVEYGWLASAQAAGSTLAGLTLSQVPKIRHQGRVLVAAVMMIGVGAIGFGLSRSLPLTLLALMLIGASDAVSSIIRNTLRQLETPDEMRGRMTGVNQVFFMGGPQLGEWRSGLFGNWIGVPAGIALGGGACILVTGWVAARWPALRKYEG